MAGWSLLLPLLLFSCLQKAHLQTAVPGVDIHDASSTVPPVTTFLPDPELRHTLEELIEESEHNSYEFTEGSINIKANNKTNANNNVTKSSTENHLVSVENSSSISASTSQPQVTTTVTTTSTEKDEMVVVPLTDRPSDSPASTPGSPTTKGIETDLISSTESTSEPSDLSAVIKALPPTESNIVTRHPGLAPAYKVGPPRKKKGPPAWVNTIARPIIFPVFLAISWLFLGFLLACHLAVPKLRENTGTPFMCYIIALMLKATVTFCNIVFKHLHSKDFCFYAAAISYLKSLAMLFWVNIMVFDIWRKSRSLVKFKPSQTVAMWKYHLYGWGTPISLSLLSLLIELLVPDSASWIIKPGFDNGYKCWFEDAESQLLYLNTPVGILHIFNVILMVFTYRYVTRITDNAFVDDDQGAPGTTLPRDTAVPAAKRTDFISEPRYISFGDDGQGAPGSTLPRDIAVPAAKRTDFISEFWFQFWILTYTVVQWVLWMIAQILQHFTGLWQLKIIPGFLIALQGLFLFIIFISNSGKRRVLKQQFPETFERISGCLSKVQKSQNKLSISKSSATSADATTEPQPVVGQTNPAFVEEENNVGQHGNIALANINKNQEKLDS